MIRKITGKNNNTPTKHLTHNNLKTTDTNDIASHLAETFSQNSSAKNQSKSFQIIKTKLYSRTKRIPQQGTQYSSRTRQNSLSVPERITWTIHKFPLRNLPWFTEQRRHTKNMERNCSYTDTHIFRRQYKYKKLQTHFSQQLCLKNIRKNGKCQIDLVFRN